MKKIENEDEIFLVKLENMRLGEHVLERVASELAKEGQKPFMVCKNWREVEKIGVMEKWRNIGGGCTALRDKNKRE